MGDGIQTPSSADLLKVWELGRDRPSWFRALLMLGPALPEARHEELAAMPLGRRNGLLLRLRQELFGSDMEASVVCPNCGERLEFPLSVEELGGTSPREDPPARFAVEHDGRTVHFRLPTSEDLASGPEASLDAAGIRALLERCIVDDEAEDGDEDVAGQVDEAADGHGDGEANAGGEAGATISDEFLDRAADAWDEADALADLRVPLRCAACEDTWSPVFDPAGFLWNEIEAEARRLLAEVTVLARAYGWTEGEILRLDPGRRQYYIEAAS